MLPQVYRCGGGLTNRANILRSAVHQVVVRVIQELDRRRAIGAELALK
jgi:hypothetical protein